MHPDYCPHVFQVFTIRGKCAACAPELHAQHAEHMALMDRLTAEFKAQTGKDNLTEWYEFERWLDREMRR